MAKGNRAPIAHHTTAPAERWMELVHIETLGPFPKSIGGSQYVVMFVDSVPRLQRPYGTRDKKAAVIFAVVKRPAEGAMSWAFKAWTCGAFGRFQDQPENPPQRSGGSTDAATTSLWMESLLWSSECFNRSPTLTNDGWLSPITCFMGAAHGCRCNHFSNRLTTECPIKAKQNPGLPCVIS